MVERAEEIYQALLNAGISEQEINQAINEKDTEFEGFMTRPAILYLIAKEHGINVESIDKEKILDHLAEDIIDYNDFAIPISSVSENMRNIVIVGTVETIDQVRDFVKKDGTPGRVGSFKICDNTECIIIVLWNENVSVMENDLFKKGETIEVIGGYTKKGRDGNLEVHLGRQSNIILAPENVKFPQGEIATSIPPKIERKKKNSTWTIKDLQNKEGFVRFISGTVKVDFFKELTLKSGEKSFLLKFSLSDNNSSIKVNVWGIKAVEYMKLIADGDKVKISNVFIKENSYTNEKELNFTKSSTLEAI